MTFIGDHKGRSKSRCAAECDDIVRTRTTPVVFQNQIDNQSRANGKRRQKVGQMLGRQAEPVFFSNQRYTQKQGSKNQPDYGYDFNRFVDPAAERRIGQIKAAVRVIKKLGEPDIRIRKNVKQQDSR